MLTSLGCPHGFRGQCRAVLSFCLYIHLRIRIMPKFHENEGLKRNSVCMSLGFLHFLIKCDPEWIFYLIEIGTLTKHLIILIFYVNWLDEIPIDAESCKLGIFLISWSSLCAIFDFVHMHITNITGRNICIQNLSRLFINVARFALILRLKHGFISGGEKQCLIFLTNWSSTDMKIKLEF